MNMKNQFGKVLPVVAGLALLQVAAPGHSAPFKSLSSVRFVQPTHNVGGQNISSTNSARTVMTTQLPISINQGLNVRFAWSFTGSSGTPSIAYINPMSHQSMIQCKTHSMGHADTNKNEVGGCTAKPAYLNELENVTTVKLRFSSPGGGGNKYLDWKFIPPPTQNGVKSIVTPGTVVKGDALSAQVILEHPAAAQQTLYWGFYPKSCFAFEGRRRAAVSDNSNLIGKVTFQPNEVQQTVDVLTTKSCSTSSAVMKVWYADPGETPNTNTNPSTPPNKQVGFSLKTPRF